MKNTAAFLFHDSLNDFLQTFNRNKHFFFQFKECPAIKDTIEAIGVPHPEVDTIFVNGTPVDFHYKLSNSDEVSVFPLPTITTTTDSSLTPAYVYPLRFIADVHAGRLAKALRMLGFDTIYDNNYNDHKIAEVACEEKRIVLTRDVGLLKHSKIKWGHWLRSQEVYEQLKEIIRKFNLKDRICLFQRCIAGNGRIEIVLKERILELLPLQTNLFFEEFYQCQHCKKVYWKGSHYMNMLRKIESISNSI